MNFKDFAFNLDKKEKNLNSTVESLCEIVNSLKEDNQKLRNENNELKKELEILKKDIKEIKEQLLPLKEEKDKEIENNIFPGNNIVKNNKEKQLILNWIKPKTKIKLTLLYQVSKDGDRTSTFYSKVSNKCPNVVLLKTNSGYECGGYTSVSWGNTNNYKRDELAFLFSLDKKKKYPLQKRKLKLCYIYLLRLFCFWKWS